MAVSIVTATPHADALAWRKSRGWSRGELSRRTGYSVTQIQDFEAGVDRKTQKPISARAWARYKLVCAAVSFGAGFNWGMEPPP